MLHPTVHGPIRLLGRKPPYDIMGEGSALRKLMPGQNCSFPGSAVVFDVDGVLIDSSARFRACLEEVGLKSLEGVRGYRRVLFWRCFLSPKYLYLDRPRFEYVSLALDYVKRGYKVVVVSGRSKAMEADTWRQLRDMGLDRVVSELILRKPGDYREEHEYKLETLRRIARKYRIEAIYDDSEKVVKALAREPYGARVFHVK